jgi:hypothetical protein
MQNIRALLCGLALAIGAAPAWAQDGTPYTLTEADAVAINARRPPEWNPHHVSAGDVFEIDTLGLIHIPSTSPTADGGEWTIEDLEPTR